MVTNRVNCNVTQRWKSFGTTSNLSKMNKKILHNCRKLVANGKGILAADESVATMQKRFYKHNIANTPENRQKFRNLLFTTNSIEKYLSGIILHDETIRQTTSEGIPFPKLLHSKGILPGIKVDAGGYALPFSDGEMMTLGLDGLRNSLKEYYELGARFAKWRAIFGISTEKHHPTDYCIRVNCITGRR
jgi:fructose-bisphosphate aldolase class I